MWGWGELGWEVVVSQTACWIHSSFVASADWKSIFSPLHTSLENIILTNDFVNTPGNWLLLPFQQQSQFGFRSWRNDLSSVAFVCFFLTELEFWIVPHLKNCPIQTRSRQGRTQALPSPHFHWVKIHRLFFLGLHFLSVFSIACYDYVFSGTERTLRYLRGKGLGSFVSVEAGPYR